MRETTNKSNGSTRVKETAAVEKRFFRSDKNAVRSNFKHIFFGLALLIALSAAASVAVKAQIASGSVYALRNQCSNKVLDVSEVSQANGAAVHQWTDVSGANQRWKIESTDNGFYKLLAVHSGKALDAWAFRTEDGTPTVQWDYVGGANQQWKLISLGGGYYKLQARHTTSKMLDVSGASTADGAKVQIWQDNGTCAQRWKLELSGGGTPAPNPNLSPEARNVLEYLRQISGNQTLSGQHDWINSNWFAYRVSEITGKYPALWGTDYGLICCGLPNNARQIATDNAKSQWEQNGLVTLSWHACRPTEDENCDWGGSVQTPLGDAEWNELLTPGTNLNNRWRAQVDDVAVYLKQLRDARVPVLWRPYHEMNGGWFWWGGNQSGTPERFKALWGMMRERLINVHGLNNLIWVWSPGAVDNAAAFYPGDQMVDVLGYDIYWGDFQNRWYDDLLSTGRGKPIAMGEVGDLPTPSVLQNQPKWTWFLTWANLLEESNTTDEIRQLYSDPRVVTRDEMPNLKAR